MWFDGGAASVAEAREESAEEAGAVALLLVPTREGANKGGNAGLTEMLALTAGLVLVVVGIEPVLHYSKQGGAERVWGVGRRVSTVAVGLSL